MKTEKSLTNKQYNVWNKLRFGNQHPSLIRKELTAILKQTNKSYTMTEDSLDTFLIIPHDTKKLWYKYDVKDDFAFFQLRYVKSMHSFIVVNQEETDLDIHIGWDEDDQRPTIIFENRHNKDDYLQLVYKDANDNAMKIAISWISIMHDIMLNYNHKKRKTKYLSAYI